MRTHRAECSAATVEVPGFADLTADIQAAVDESGIGAGQVTIFSPDASCVLMLNERETGLLDDIRQTMARLGTPEPEQGRALVGSTSVVVPAADGRLCLGTWQRVLLVELSAPQKRNVVVQIVGE